MNIDQARAGGEGTISKEDTKKKMKDGPPTLNQKTRKSSLKSPMVGRQKNSLKTYTATQGTG